MRGENIINDGEASPTPGKLPGLHEKRVDKGTCRAYELGRLSRCAEKAVVFSGLRDGDTSQARKWLLSGIFLKTPLLTEEESNMSLAHNLYINLRENSSQYKCIV